MTDSCLVIDNGSGTVKAGIAGNGGKGGPSIDIGETIQTARADASGPRSKRLSKQASILNGEPFRKYPIQQGVVTNWDEMEKIWSDILEKLKVQRGDTPILITEAPLTPKKEREKMMEIVFGSFGAPGFYTAIPAVLALRASGRTTGLVLGEGVTHAVPIYDGHAIPHGVSRCFVSGGDLTEYLTQMMMNKDCPLARSADQKTIRDMKEKLCYVALDFEQEKKRALVSSPKCCHPLEDGQGIKIENERFTCPEVFFNPQLLSKTGEGIHETVLSSMNKIRDIDLRSDLFGNIVLSGGPMSLPGMGERLQKELASLVTDHTVSIITPNNFRYAAWIGGSELASQPTFKQMMVTKQEYEDHGSWVVHMKCF